MDASNFANMTTAESRANILPVIKIPPPLPVASTDVYFKAVILLSIHCLLLFPLGVWARVWEWFLW